MYQKQIEFIAKYVAYARERKEKLLIVLVMNVKNITKSFRDYTGTSVISEYYSYDQYEEIITAIHSLGYQVKCYFDENDFISDFELGVIRNNYPKKMLVINSAQKGIGPGRKSLIPAFCQLHNILCASSNPYTVSFARNKFHWYCFLKELSFPVCPSWLYNKREGWLGQNHPPLGETVILKLNSESSSIGLTKDNIIKYDYTKDAMIADICKKFNQDVIVEKFINGFETEVPVLISAENCCSLFPAGISISNKKCIGNEILDYDVRGNHKFEHYNFHETDSGLATQLEITTEKVALSMGIKNMGRIDYRIDTNGNYYITDIATNPHITKSMTFYYEFKKFGLDYPAVLETLIGLALSWEKI